MKIRSRKQQDERLNRRRYFDEDQTRREREKKNEGQKENDYASISA